MVKAEFKRNYFFNIITLLCSLFLLGLFVFIKFKDNEATLSFLLIGISIGTVCSLLSIFYLFFNHKAFLHISETGEIKAKYHWFNKLSCNITEIEYAAAQMSTLFLHFKNGKVLTITGIKNPLQIATIINFNMQFDVKEQPEKLIYKFNELKIKRKERIVYAIAFLICLFICIFFAVGLTDGKETYDFDLFDWIIFSVFGTLSLPATFFAFYFADKIGKDNINLEKLRYQIHRIIIETSPPLPGNIIKIYTDEQYSRRITLYNIPNDSSFYYTIEGFSDSFSFFKFFESGFFEDGNELLQALEEFIDITEKVFHK